MTQLHRYFGLPDGTQTWGPGQGSIGVEKHAVTYNEVATVPNIT